MTDRRSAVQNSFMARKSKIVITGGPSGGKTTLIEALKKELGSQVGLVPESASILYRGGFPRLPGDKIMKHTQLAIYHAQRELEAVIEDSTKAAILICDRGSLDGIAYWPTNEASLFAAIDSSREKEMARYDWVIHLDTAARDFYETTNPVRIENFDEALELNERVKKAWRGHERRFVISANSDFLSKMTLSVAVIRAILEGRSVEEIQSALLS